MLAPLLDSVAAGNRCRTPSLPTSIAGTGSVALAVAGAHACTCSLAGGAAHGLARRALGNATAAAQHVLFLGLIGAFYHDKQAFCTR